MNAAAHKLNDWKDGFLFVANRPILDFLNTKPVLADGPTELLTDVRALERWMVASGMINSIRDRAAVRKWRDSAEAEAFLKQLITFRERLREAVLRIESGKLPGDAFVSEVNSLLLQHPQLTSLHKRDGKLIRETRVELHTPSDLWALIANGTANLLVEKEPSRVRKCESCVVHFFDTSKKGSRRWCSMNICGNKVKVAAYQQRKRAN
ncbi:CGNR zinc finger domain-containing protein [Terriglobus aquaticus]|uniref:CGNR zinc finger domain-containing protein n=1 Tax=Terriglobus aquaticus TaxID=940139 RepID=A0ABW9KLG8_9BACT|nr:ABATE domain-containing protein [Terriglobus aquaticus]